MKYHGKAVEVIGTKDVLGEQVAWVRMLEDNSFFQVSVNELTANDSEYGMPYIRHIAIAAKIKDEVSKKKILAPYSIPVPILN